MHLDKDKAKHLGIEGRVAVFVDGEELKGCDGFESGAKGIAWRNREYNGKPVHEVYSGEVTYTVDGIIQS